MKIKKALPTLIAVILLITSVLLLMNHQKSKEHSITPSIAQEAISVSRPEETRGIWVTYMTLDVENETDKESALRQKIDAIIRDMKRGNLNTMIVQVRPFCDAIYPSKYYPWSHIISGEQGVDPGFDPLELIVEKCRENRLYLHAWVNPYRVATEHTPAELCGENPYRKDPSIGVEINGSRYLNPASEDARKLIADGVRELVENYDIDGIQFDDYFYPEDCGDFDAADFKAFLRESGKKISLAEFRRYNVSKMVAEAYKAAHDAKKSINFGISPQGNLRNNDSLFADVRTWCAKPGYIDYICPQIYFSPDNPALKFEDCLNAWSALKKHSALQTYVGLAVYKAGTDADKGTWLDNSDILKTEISIARKSNTDGFILYSYDSFIGEDQEAEVENVIRYLTTSAAHSSS